MTQDRFETSWNWRPMVGSAVATMVWSRAAKNIVSIRLMTMVRTSSDDSGARVGASLTLMTSPGRRVSSSAMSSGNVWMSADWLLCRANWFISGVSDVVLRRKAAKDSFYEANVDSKVLLRQAPRRMGASRTAVIPNT